MNNSTNIIQAPKRNGKKRRYLIIGILLLIIVFYISVSFKYQGGITVEVVDAITKLPIENATVKFQYRMDCPGFEPCVTTVKELILYSDREGLVKIPHQLIYDGLFNARPRIHLEVKKEKYYPEPIGTDYTSLLYYMNNNKVKVTGEEAIKTGFSSEKLLVYLFPVLKNSLEQCRLLEVGLVKDYCSMLNAGNVLIATRDVNTCYDVPIKYLSHYYGYYNRKDCLMAAVMNGYFDNIKFAESACEEIYKVEKKTQKEWCENILQKHPDYPCNQDDESGALAEKKTCMESINKKR